MKINSIIWASIFCTSLFAIDGELLTINDYDAYTLEELMNVTITSSTGTEVKISDAPSIATVITAEQIERSSARTLSEVMQMASGVHVYYPLGTARQEAYDIRGINTKANNQILTLINGISIKKYELGQTMLFFEFPASLIQRVEIIRGPGSAVYGADAFSGTINIITKDAKYLSKYSQAGVRYGSFNTSEVYGNYGEVYKSGLKMGLNLSYMNSDGDDSRIFNADTQTGLDATFGTNASLAPAAYNTSYKVFNMSLNLEYEEFSMNLWAYNQDNGLISGGSNTLDLAGTTTGSYVVSDFNYNIKIDNGISWNNKFILSYNEMSFNSSLFPSGTTLPVGDDGNFFTTGGGLVSFTEGTNVIIDTFEKMAGLESTLMLNQYEDHNIRLGIGYHYTTLDVEQGTNFGAGVLDGTQSTVDGTLTNLTDSPYKALPNSERGLFFLTLQDMYTISNAWQLTTGIRYDDYSDIGNTINPRIGLVNHTTDTITTKLLYGRAFRVPSAGELGFQNNPALLGNPDLEPETIDMLELGMVYTPNKKLLLSTNIYGYKIDNLISQTNTQRQYNNIGSQDGAGLEIESTYQITGDLILKADYSYRWTKNNTTDEPVAGSPKHIGHAMFDYGFIKNWYLNSDLMFAADRTRASTNTNEEIDDYVVINTTLGYKVYKGLEVMVAIRNIFDEVYYDPTPTGLEDFPSAGRSYFAELKYRF